ncbi:pyridoxamine 5'-phosphate oxidase-related FMN-binding protein [Halalkaliarchaeum desulfuricum]|uniref:Pyridoxamine 5'-phosphate oxidase-related FMN-binding protein n=1 Tax=Halalkaliarchaeum desulfuricum TaxID=2055893 RepID=A0A343TMA0_9EURY|nr:pyridoxamine 5'-phosphate oxidase family protein [Halalkaliarchaeum desulfuricum]AUX10222.1 pyridoxamine 5'-phosphate oxidase-related FMN-binding protein [Halalkaliarchaeum desulfuricum]
MTEYRGSWTAEEVEDFLEEAKIPVRLATTRPDGSMWIVTLWFRYRDGSLECATQENSAVVRFLRNDPEVAFEVSTNQIPYRGIRGTGVTTVSTDSDKRVLRDLVDRYLGDTDSSLAKWLLSEDRSEVSIRIDMQDVYSWDYSDRMNQ